MNLLESYLGSMKLPDRAVLERTWSDLLQAHGDQKSAITILAGRAPETPDWAPLGNYDDMLKAGLYSPIQILAWQCAIVTEAQIATEYPFGFSHIALAIQLLVDGRRNKGPGEWPPAPAYYQTARRLLQSVFLLREQREEREPSSIEIVLPLDASKSLSPEISVEKLGHFFGRGVSTIGGDNLTAETAPRGFLSKVFTDHTTAPLSQLYNFSSPFEHLGANQISIVLRRDGHLTVSGRGNPLLEFYGGAWHVVDLTGGVIALQHLLRKQFPGRSTGEVARPALNVAYHLATHWHGSIVAIVDEGFVEGDKLMKQKASDAAVGNVVRQVMDSQDLLITKLSGHGRLLFGQALQDGALLISPEGRFLSAGRMVEKVRDTNDGGAGARAAQSFGADGVAMKISQDGPIKLYSSKNDTSLVPSATGLRLH